VSTTTGKTVLVTGGAGFIGSHLTRRLLADGYEVRVLDNFATGSRENLEEVEDSIELVEGDIQSYERVHNAVRGCELVFHQAAMPSVPRSIQDPTSQYAAVIPNFITAFLEDRQPTVHGDGEQSRDFCFISNVIDANLGAAEAGEEAAGEAFNIACGERTSLNQMLDMLRSETGKDLDATYVDPRPGDVPHSQADISKAADVLGYNPVVGMAEGLGIALASYEDRLHRVAAGSVA
jgi:nucleoside-diphosphate-sugar epimerase